MCIVNVINDNWIKYSYHTNKYQFLIQSIKTKFTIIIIITIKSNTTKHNKTAQPARY